MATDLDRVRRVDLCLVGASWLCVTYTDGLPFWEITANVAVTGAVTFLTIFWSVRLARSAAKQEVVRAERADRVDDG